MTFALFIDLDGLLVDTETASLDAWLAAADRLALPVSRAVCESMIGTTVAGADQILADHLGSRAAVGPLRDLRDALLQEMEPLQAMPGAAAMLRFARDSGFLNILVTSSTREAAAGKLASGGLDSSVFAHGVYASNSMASKPDPAPYEAALTLLPTDAHPLAALEDSINGVRSASGAGLFAIHVSPYPHDPHACKAAGAGACVEDLGKVPAILELRAGSFGAHS